MTRLSLVRQRRTVSRRGFLRSSARGIGLLGLGMLGNGAAVPVARAQGGGADSFGPLQPADANGLLLPAGFSSRVLAVTGEVVPGTTHLWHERPDGGATFATNDGGWVYVSNSETSRSGGVGALRFDRDANVVDAYSILSDTSRNCAGGPTPWGTWLSCEETASGEVYECDPFTPGSQGIVRPGLGTFCHEAAAVDPFHTEVYLTEDESDGLLYRFTPDVYPSLASGTLEAAEVLDPAGDGPIAPGEVRALDWHVVPDPTVQLGTDTRDQVPSATPFDGGEGCWYEAGLIYFSTKGDCRIWRVDTANQTIEILYDEATAATPHLSNVDNVYAAPGGDVYVAEDPGNLQIVALTPSGGVVPIVELDSSGTEITGPVLSPDGWRLYFSSQRNPGETFEVTGPFLPAPAVPGVGGLARVLLAAALAAAGTRALHRDESAAGDDPIAR